MDTKLKQMLMEEAQDDRTRALLFKTMQIYDGWIGEVMTENARLHKENRRLPTMEPMRMSQQEGAGWTCIQVRADQIGRVIGKGRQNLTRVEQRYKVLIDVCDSGRPMRTSEISPSVPVTIKIFGSYEDRHAAGRDITDKLQTALSVALPHWLMPLMMEGHIARSLNAVHGVRVEVSTDCPMTGCSDASGELIIRGSIINCRAAQNDVLSFIQKHRPAM